MTSGAPVATWAGLSLLAGRSHALLEACAEAERTPVLDFIPEVLGVENGVVGEPVWASTLDEVVDGGITKRELLLRWLITRAIVDQGSDVEGVQLWYTGWLTDCYGRGIRILHEPLVALERYKEIVEIADLQRKSVTTVRAEIWASQGESRSIGAYNPFNVDNIRSKEAHWFVSARVLPGILTAFLRQGGLTEHIFGSAFKETPSQMARRLYKDEGEHRLGLGHCMGDKACDLFAKWAVGTFRLADGLATPWTPSDCPLPMDQRIGRVLMRMGFMDEFFGVLRMLMTKSCGFTPPEGALRPEPGQPLPKGRWHLTVKDFRRNSRVKNREILDWLRSSVGHGGVRPAVWRPQDVLSSICRVRNSDVGNSKLHITPVELDDFLMKIAEVCTDDSPKCSQCTLKEICQANSQSSMAALKSYIT